MDAGLCSGSRFIFYRACDISTTCRLVLDHTPRGSLHIAGDMLDRFKPEVLTRLRGMLASAEVTLSERLSVDGVSMSARTCMELTSEIGRSFMRVAWSSLGGDVLQGRPMAQEKTFHFPFKKTKL